MASIRATTLAACLGIALAAPAAGAAAPVAPVQEPGAIPLYPAPAGDTAGSKEIWSIAPGQGRSVRNVSVPEVTPVLPDPAKANGAAVVVLPGGAFMALSMDHEGYKVARSLADRGIAAFVVKYRLLPTPEGEREAGMAIAQRITASRRDPAQKLESPAATADALAALGLVRANAAKWQIDPARVGAIGYSAGAITSLNMVLKAPPAERPAFFGYIYGPQDAVDVPADAPPLFDAIAMDDPLFPTNGFPIVASWRAAKRPVELHAYQKGGHGFGLGKAGTTNSLLIDQFTAWLAMQGFLTPRNEK